jgi:hypothetical protein
MKHPLDITMNLMNHIPTAAVRLEMLTAAIAAHLETLPRDQPTTSEAIAIAVGCEESEVDPILAKLNEEKPEG